MFITGVILIMFIIGKLEKSFISHSALLQQYTRSNLLYAICFDNALTNNFLSSISSWVYGLIFEYNVGKCMGKNK